MLGANKSAAAEMSSKVVEFETTLANISIDEVERYDTGQWYTKLTVQQLIQEVPGFDWMVYLNTIGPGEFKPEDEVVCYAMPYLRKLSAVINQTDTSVIYNYIMWRLVMDLIPFLPPQYQVPRAEFRRVLLGVLAERNRWAQCVEWTNKKMGMAVGPDSLDRPR